MCFSPVKAIDIFVPTETTQGSTLEIKISDPESEISSINGTFNEEDIYFYETKNTPLPDENISRAEFLKLTLDNQSLLPIGPVREVFFTDTTKTYPYYKAIQKAVAFKIIQDYEDATFRPDEPITRGEAAEVLIKLFNPPKVLPTSQTFSDLPSTHIHYAALTHALQSKVFQGYANGLIRPDRPITFYEAEIIVQRVSMLGILKKNFTRTYFQGLVGISRLKDPGEKTLSLHIQKKFCLLTFKF